MGWILVLDLGVSGLAHLEYSLIRASMHLWLLPLLYQSAIQHCCHSPSWCLLYWLWSNSSLLQLLVVASNDLACKMTCLWCLEPLLAEFGLELFTARVRHNLGLALAGTVCWSVWWFPTSRRRSFGLSRLASGIQCGLYHILYNKCSSDSLEYQLLSSVG
jgi:hypothetical protein